MKLLPLCAATLLVSCSAPPLTKRVDSLLLSRAPGEVIAPVEATRGLALSARDARADAARLVRERAAAVERARGELAVAAEHVDEARVAAAEAAKRGTPAEAAAAQAGYEELLGIAEISRLRVALSKRAHETAVLRESVALEETALAQARLELASGRAVERLDLGPGAAIALADLREEERFALREVEHAKQRLSAARVAEERARGAFDAALEASASTRGGGR
ncbi:MAG: hypothetical protein VX460_00115 [Planctomycetota bacterium]|nr:hypothetical protein [Planctomycetota bacterium]